MPRKSGSLCLSLTCSPSFYIAAWVQQSLPSPRQRGPARWCIDIVVMLLYTFSDLILFFLYFISWVVIVLFSDIDFNNIGSINELPVGLHTSCCNRVLSDLQGGCPCGPPPTAASPPEPEAPVLSQSEESEIGNVYLSQPITQRFLNLSSGLREPLVRARLAVFSLCA